MSERSKARLSWISAAAGAAVVVASAYPGVLTDTGGILTLVAVLWIPGWLGVAWLLVSAKGAEGDPDAAGEGSAPAAGAKRGVRSRRAAAAVILSSLALAATGWPRLAAFRASRSAFDRPVAAAPAPCRAASPSARTREGRRSAGPAMNSRRWGAGGASSRRRTIIDARASGRA